MAAQTRNRSLILVGILAYLVFLLALFPINIAYKILNPQGLPVSVEALSGTLWQGSGVLKERQVGRLDVTWSLNPWALVTQQVSADVKVKGQQVRFNGHIDLGLQSFHIPATIQISDAKGYVAADLVNQFARQQRASIQGDLELSALNLSYNLLEKQAQSASGRLVWQGGQVAYPVGRDKRTANMPMLVGQLSTESGNLLANVSTTSGEAVAQANLKNDGWAGIAIKRRLLDLAGEKWPGQGNADTSVFEVSEKVF